ncbi:family 43 glycosyl hydrolase [Echria macrotheca]|uniref:Family 43 glycosyl hydrolase n=1 Tax=Echria macrotheca TaxID=438768 RepID=A0AAJ0F9U5_9PEZI|nr:family 43 glycosyl hydrolase [Echria macrotheca]
MRFPRLAAKTPPLLLISSSPSLLFLFSLSFFSSSSLAAPTLSPPIHPPPPPPPSSPLLSISTVLPRDTPSRSPSLLLNTDFPDPTIVHDPSSQKWYAFATASSNKNIQAASAPSPSGPWTLFGSDVLPDTGAWTTGRNSWAPDVRVIVPGSRYVMYYSGEIISSSKTYHCVGVAVASSILGPYIPDTKPFACPLARGGAIDPSGYFDRKSGERYVVYKVDGNAIGHGGYCGNGVAPYASTPIMLQRVDASDGTTALGDPVEILDREQEADGPLVEAPDLFRTENGTYVLLYSNQCWDSPGYTVSYATSDTVGGHYVKRGVLLGTGDWELTAPGGATVADPDPAPDDGTETEGGWMVFHANCPGGKGGRCMFGTAFRAAAGGVVAIG